MVKRIACRVLLAAFALLLAFPVLSLADDRPMVVDLAELYTDSEEAQMIKNDAHDWLRARTNVIFAAN